MSSMPGLLGARVGAYELQAILGRGGMATVYQGFDHNLQRPVAIKVLSEVAASQPDFINRFRQEARLLARLRHPNIVQVYDLIEQDSVLYMVQELLPGRTLSERLFELSSRRQMMPRREIIAVMQQLAAALDAAHAAGIIHRDVKPGNVLYTADGSVVLTDFGIAKSSAADATTTQTGIVLGTPTYISPEQARGEALTPSSDIYALGVVLYELISGQPPFDGGTPLGIVLKHLHDPPPPLQPLRASVTPEVEAVVQRAMAKSSDERFATASRLAQALVQAWPEPAHTIAPGSIHDLPTTAWEPPNPSAIAPAARLDTAAIGTQPAPIAGAAPPPRPTRSLLPLLALLLVGALLLGVVLASRGNVADTPSRTPITQTGTESQETPSATPALPAEPDSGPLQPLREILGADASPAMLTTLDTTEQALAADDKPAATQMLGALQQQILAGRRDGTLSAETMRAALAALQEIADRNGLELPLEIG